LGAAKSRFANECPYYLALAEELEEAQVPLPIVFGHNDLLPANLLDDGDRLWLIDFEYAGFNTAMFDIAGLASNAGMTHDESEDLFRAYFGRPPDAALRRSYASMQCASLLREAMWSMVSEIHLAENGVNYVEYTEQNLEKLRAALDTYQVQHGKLI
jgi:thiamine kinase-like enzyme